MPRTFSNDDYLVSKFLNNVLMRETAFNMSGANMFSTNIFVGLAKQTITLPTQATLPETQWQAGGSAFFLSASAFAHVIAPAPGVTINGSSSSITFSATPYATQLQLIRIAGDSWLALATESASVAPSIGSTTWASIPAANSVAIGTQAYVTDLGGGVNMISNGSYWRPINGSMNVFAQTANITTANSTAEQIFTAAQIVLPANLLQIGCKLRPVCTIGKSSATGNATLRQRFGAAGTTADAQVITFSMPQSASYLSAGWLNEFLIESATQIRALGTTQPYTFCYVDTTAVATPVTFGNINTANTFSVTSQCSVGATLQTLYSLSMEVIFP